MTDNTNTTPAAAATDSAPAAKTVQKDMATRRIFPNAAEALAYLALCAETFADWSDMPFAAPGIDSEGNFDPAVYSDSMDVMVAKLSEKGTKDSAGSVKAVVVAPVPKIDVIMSDESGRAWVEKILHKELNHVAVRALREAEDISTVIDQMPTTLSGYIESGRAGAGILETFNLLYKQINATLSAKLPVWAKYRLIKTELRKAMESKGYASEIYAALEDYKGESLFVAAIKLGIAAAKRKGLDPAIFERWLATRDQKTYDAATADDEDELNIDDLTDSLLADESEDADEAETVTA